MPNEKQVHNVMAFKVDDDVIEYIQQVMIQTRVFNRSTIQREIFMMGLALYKQKNPHIKVDR